MNIARLMETINTRASRFAEMLSMVRGIKSLAKIQCLIPAEARHGQHRHAGCNLVFMQIHLTCIVNGIWNIIGRRDGKNTRQPRDL